MMFFFDFTVNRSGWHRNIGVFICSQKMTAENGRSGRDSHPEVLIMTIILLLIVIMITIIIIIIIIIFIRIVLILLLLLL